MENNGNVEAKFENAEESEAGHEAAAPQIQNTESEEENPRSNYKRFRQNQEVRDMQFQARYEDMASYVEQRAHSLGEGLFCTDDYQDLPPRFKKKFLSLCESVGFKIDYSTSEIVCFSPNINIDFGKRNSENHTNVQSGASVSDTLLQNQSSSGQSFSNQDNKTGRHYWSDNKSVAANEQLCETTKKNNYSKSNRFVDIVKEHSDLVSQQQKETDNNSGINFKEKNRNTRRDKFRADFNNEKPHNKRNRKTEYSNPPEFTSSHNQSKGGKFAQEKQNDRFSHQNKNENFNKKEASHQGNFGKSIKDDVQNFIEQHRATAQTAEPARKPYSTVNNKVKNQYEESDNMYYYKAGRINYRHEPDFARGKARQNDSYRRASNTSQPTEFHGSKCSNSSLENSEPMSRHNLMQNQKLGSKNVSNSSEKTDHYSCKGAQMTYKDSNSSISSPTLSNKSNFSANKFSNKESSSSGYKDTEFKADCDKLMKVPRIDKSLCKNSSVDTHKKDNYSVRKENSNLQNSQKHEQNVSRFRGDRDKSANIPPTDKRHCDSSSVDFHKEHNNSVRRENLNLKNSQKHERNVSQFKQDRDRSAKVPPTDKSHCDSSSVDIHKEHNNSVRRENFNLKNSHKHEQNVSQFKQDRDKSAEVPPTDKSRCDSSSVDAHKENNDSVRKEKFNIRNRENYEQNESRPSSRGSSVSKMSPKVDKGSAYGNQRENRYNKSSTFAERKPFRHETPPLSKNSRNKNKSWNESDNCSTKANSLKNSKVSTSTDSLNSQNENFTSKSNIKRPVCVEKGFFLKVNVSENSKDVQHWQRFFTNLFHPDKFEIDHCCNFSGTLIINFELKNKADDARLTLKGLINKAKKFDVPHVEKVSNLKFTIKKPCDCNERMVQDFRSDVNKLTDTHVEKHTEKIRKILSQLKSISNKETQLTLKETIKTLKDSQTVFENYVNNLYSKLETVETMLDVRKLRVDFSRECNSFARCLPIYSQKEKILELLRYYSVSVIVAETGSGKSTQLVEYFLQTDFAQRGTIICTQPRKIAAIGLAEYVSKQLGSSVGKTVGYDIGLEKKYCEESKILYVTDYCLLKRILVNKKLTGISCVIVDEAHERTLHTDLLLSLLKLCIVARPDFRVVITSATINPTVFRNYFSLKDEMIICIPGRLYPVEVIWLEEDVTPDWNYLEACVKLAHHIHVEKSKGDILVFLTSPNEVEDAVQLFKTICKRNSLPQLIGLHGKSDLNEQRLIFQNSIDSRKVIFATNSAETSLTIPGIKFVVDSGMAKEKIFFPRKNKSSLVVSFINKSSAEQRKGRAGRTQPGICYRMYSKNNYHNMKERALPELLKTNIQTAILKIMEFGVEPKDFDFVESPPKEAFSKSIESLELLGAIENNKLTDMGKSINKMTIEPRLAKLVLEGIRNDIGYEAIIIASLVSESAKLFSRNECNKDEADKMKVKFCKKEGDLWTFLDVYKQWQEVHWQERDAWCTRHYINSRALKMASKSVDEILKNLRLDLATHVLKRYNNSAFKANFQNVIFSCYSENLCVFSGHPKVGYFSPYLSESFCIHPSSAISYLRIENPMFLVYSNLMETSRNFMLDVTPLSEEIIRKECSRGAFKLDIAMLKRFQILPKVMGPFGESVLIRHVLGKGGRKIVELESIIEKYTKTKNFKIDVLVDKGEIIIYVEKRFHEKIANYINEMVVEAHKEMLKEEDTIRMPNSSSYCCLGAGGIISDIIMPGEFKEITIELQNSKTVDEVLKKLEEFGELRSFKVKNERNRKNICVTFEKVSQARTALLQLNKERGIHFVRSNVFIPKEIKKSLPLFTLDVTWCRRPVSGYGFVEFKTESDCVLASGTFARSSFYIDDKYINFAPSKHSSRHLHMTNLPATVSEEMIEAKLKAHLPDFLPVKNVNLMRSKQDKLTEEDIGHIKLKLLKLFGKYSASDKMIVDVKYPKSSDVFWRAFIYFENIKDGESAFKLLNGRAEIDSFPVKMRQVLTSRLFCSLGVYKAVESEIMKLVRMKSEVCDQFSSEYNSKTEKMVIKFGCKNILELNSMQQTIMNLILGRQINCFGNSKYLFLFNQNGKSLLKYIQDSTCTYICVNDVRRILSIYGSHEACREAELRIHSLATAPTTRKVFDIKRSSMPSGFLKALYSKYGFDLHELLNTFKLKVANVDVVPGTLTLEGDKENVKKAENELEEICSQLSDSSNQNVLENNLESCAICLENVNYDFLRLEHCGHAFCRHCLLLQLESRSIPLKCIKENCEKFLFLEDIKKILSSGGQDLKKSFCLAAVQYHVNSNLDKLSYCPTPDCPMVYRRSNEISAEFNCPLCENVICRSCQTLYHHGMSCEMFLNSKEDSDYSLKCWMKENNIDRKFCPQCKVAIEKNSGCNHIECLNCKAHLCWPCLKVFSKSEDVYEHQPYCAMNQ